jgi:hypothetical protein
LLLGRLLSYSLLSLAFENVVEVEGSTRKDEAIETFIFAFNCQ